MLGESIITSEADPTKAGQSVREVGTNPFIVGSEGEQGNLCFLLNTGGFGGREIERSSEPLDSSAAVAKLRGSLAGTKHPDIGTTTEIARSRVEWRKDEYWGYEVPVAIPGIDLGRYDLNRYYRPDELAALLESLRAERTQWLAKFKDLDPVIARAVK